MNQKGLLIASFLVVIIIHHITYGLGTLVPTNISWLMTAMHDWGTHYLGWAFYKDEPWGFPLGNISRYYYPLGTNVGFTDSIPLFAIFFKLFKSILPSDFQYFGLWLFTCYLLTAYFTIRLLQLFKLHPYIIFIGVIFLTANPVLVYRGLHPALCAHWLIIASLYLYFSNPQSTNPRQLLKYQLILLLLAASINPYLWFMVLGFNIALPLKLAFFDKVLKKRSFYLYAAASITATIFCWYLIGMVTFSHQEDFAVQGAYGLYSLNLNSLYNATGFSTLLPAFKQVSWHQYEGFMYLGAGIMLLLPIALIYLVPRVTKKSDQPLKNRFFLRSTNTKLLPLLLLVLIISIFSITHIVSFNDKVLFKIPIPDKLAKLGEVFRASARCFWLPYYLILFTVIITLAKTTWSLLIRVVVLMLALGLQLYDTKFLLTYRNLSYGSYKTPLDDETWGALFDQFDKIEFYPPFASHQLTPMDYQYFCYLAVKKKKPINIGYVARANNTSMERYRDTLTSRLEEGKLDPKTLYISTSPHLKHFVLAVQTGACQVSTLNNYFYFYSRKGQTPKTSLLSGQLTVENKAKLDSVMQIMTKRVVFTKVIKPSFENAPKSITYYVTRANNGSQYLSTDGWAFIEATNNNKGDSTFIALSSDTSFYTSPANIIQRPDVTSHFKKEDLSDAGFESLSFFDNIPAGKYEMGLMIKNKAGKYYYQPVEKTISVGTADQSIPANQK
ncbi:hypothetical protein D3H65_27420 [Paraflavitalea soli]|uniref:Glycosyltransferase RgtA/B/C/D-like domain-containing protein n=2 Tax=Paraflavitalea soli TaxID=2315862 RepID=A0A3B7MWU3_9BACT|nr:hypothetical protein D3H65_27420 [Paraflavitalea soli]